MLEVNKFLVKLLKGNGTEVTAVVEASNENQAKEKALKTANSIAKEGGSKVLKSAIPLKVKGVEAWEAVSTKVMKGEKQYGVLLVRKTGNIEDLVKGVAGEKSAYNIVIKQLQPKEEVRVFIYDTEQKSTKEVVKKPLDYGKMTIKEALLNRNISFDKLYNALSQDDLGDWNSVNSTDIIKQYTEEMIEKDIQVEHIVEALEQGCSTDVWKIWLGNSMETPQPVTTKEELVDALSLEDEESLAIEIEMEK